MVPEIETILATRIATQEQTYSKRDTMLYALGAGIGIDPVDLNQLRFVYEQDLQVMPTQACVLAWTRISDLEFGLDKAKFVHGEQSSRFFKRLPVEGTVVVEMRVADLFDRGAGKGAILVLERNVRDKANGELLSTQAISVFCRGDGGFGGPPPPAATTFVPPTAEPDAICDCPTSSQGALIYRLSGDYNPLHADPLVARKVGFERPILHGLATYASCGWSILKAFGNYEPESLSQLDGRFSSPVYPGENIRVEMWRNGKTIHFRARVAERNVTVFSNGVAQLR